MKLEKSSPKGPKYPSMRLIVSISGIVGILWSLCIDIWVLGPSDSGWKLLASSDYTQPHAPKWLGDGDSLRCIPLFYRTCFRPAVRGEMPFRQGGHGLHRL